MQERNLYEYAVLRYVPDIERDEFINVGLLMMCKRRRWIRIEIHLDQTKLEAMGAPHSREEIEHRLATFVSTALGQRSAGPMAELPVEERFRWLTAVKSASLQTSRPHPGLTDDLDASFATIFNRLVR